MNDEPFTTLKAHSKLDMLVFPYQVHCTAGLVVNAQTLATTQSFAHDADWLITNVPGIGLGILTADCVPLLVYDPVHKAIGAIHAGWRGAVEGVVVAALEGMKSAFGTHPSDIQVWIGPHARTCCYQVDQQFYDTVMKKKFGIHSWHKRDGQLFFDLKHCNFEQLVAYGIPKQNITDIGICTICDPVYCSYRREKDNAQRNISFIGLNN